ncbi:MAG: hypothetical protein R2712_06310 [Vicinamibacterales bacterium]
MVDAAIGRLLIASLHQGIADIAPTRLDFYENWLSPTGLRDGRMGLAPLGAVLSFLHREPPPADHEIPDRAGRCAAEWAWSSVSGARKALIRRLPLGLRTRAALGLCRRLAREAIGQSSVSWRLRRGRARVDIQSAIFEYLRQPSAAPMRRFYASAFRECLLQCDIEAHVTVEEAAGCRLAVEVIGDRAPTQALLDVA